MFSGCVSLRSALNKCTFNTKYTSLIRSFLNCVKLKHVLNHCGEMYMGDGYPTFINNIELCNITGTTFVIDKNLDNFFINCEKLSAEKIKAITRTKNNIWLVATVCHF